MTKWEYKIELIQGTRFEVIDELNILGSKGWECCGTANTRDSFSVSQHYLFKRQLVESNPELGKNYNPNAKQLASFENGEFSQWITLTDESGRERLTA
jgi:hypothetical protein